MLPTDTKIINIISPQHTGTWFAINFLSKHPEVHHFAETSKILEYTNEFHFGKTNLLHIHFPLCKGEISTRNFNPLKHHPFNHVLVKTFIHTFPTVIPVRDPLLSLISRHNRCPQGTHLYLVRSFIQLAQMHTFDTVTLLPVDLPLPTQERTTLLTNVIDHVGLSPAPELVRTTAEKWPIANTHSTSGKNLKNAYLANDLATIQSAIQDEVTLLRKNESKIRPFLEKVGYRNLIWWS